MKRVIVFSKISLAFLWLFTSITSFWWDRATGHLLLSNLKFSTHAEDCLINIGSLCDLLIGLWILSGKFLMWNYRIQIFVIGGYSLIISCIDPQLWLHPFGPITKNIPIIALVLMLMKSHGEKLQ